jgi:propionyl-CoA carboxylase alpha chain
VEQMIRVAAGERLAFSQADVAINGWSIETRVYAEDPYRGFLPSTGRLVRYQPPSRLEDQGYIRIDDGVAEGGEVSIHYDPMIAKLITWAPTRLAAADLQIDALDRFVIDGPGHNIDFLSAIMQHPRFRSGDLSTGFIAEEWPEGFTGAPASPQHLRTLAALFAGAEVTWQARAGRPDRAPTPASQWLVKLAGQRFTVELADGGATVDGTWISGTWDWQPGQRLSTASADGKQLALQLLREGTSWRIITRGAQHRATVLPLRLAGLAAHMQEKLPPDLSRYLICPMPGLLVALHVAAGDHVQPGQILATVEAMKMENILRAERAGTVLTIGKAQGDSLAVGDIILELGADET